MQSAAAARAWISLGGNVPWNGLAGAALFEAVLAVLAEGGFASVRTSRVWVGPAWPDPSDPPFYNAVAGGRWAGAPVALMSLLLRTEDVFGRRRSVKNAPRTLDLDLLDIEGGRGRFEPDLVVPHPRLSVRPFILGPWPMPPRTGGIPIAGALHVSYLKLLKTKSNIPQSQKCR